MGTRGRRSIAELMVVNGAATPANRPDPPRDLDAAEATEWREIVGSMPPGSFPRRLYVTLELLCRHTGNGQPCLDAARRVPQTEEV